MAGHFNRTIFPYGCLAMFIHSPPSSFFCPRSNCLALCFGVGKSSGMSPPKFPLGAGTDSDHFYHLGKMVGWPFQPYDFTVRLPGNVHSSLAPFGSATVLIIFFSSDATRRSSFLRSFSGGRSSGLMPRSTSRFRTL